MSETEDLYRCTLTGPDAADRIEADRALAARVVATERSESGVRITFVEDDDTRRLVDTFVTNESRCCGFFDFDVTEAGGSVTLQITAPPDEMAQGLVDAARQAFVLGPDGLRAAMGAQVDGG